MSVSRRVFAIGMGTLPLLRPAVAAEEGASENDQRAASSSKPKFFDVHELATVAAMADVIIPATDTPGAREARVAEYLDLILAESDETARTAFREGLWWTEGYARRTASEPFKDLAAAEQLRILTELHDSSDDANATGRRFVYAMKSWTARIYYSTEIGHNELNKGGRIPATYYRSCG